MAFRVTVHDDHVVGGCSDYVNTSITFDAEAGPFELSYPSESGIIWLVGTTRPVYWDVANTDNATVNCQFVNIYLSVDGGSTYPHLLAEQVPNTGEFTVMTPNLPNTTSRVMVMAENGTFFDISDNNFEIRFSAVGLEHLDLDSQVHVFPNPNDGQVQITWTQDQTFQQYRVLDARGRTLLRGQITGENLPLDLSSVDSGLYFVELLAGEKRVMRKVVKN
jgi:hypothetical protein